jgi:hypothetical protein
MLATQRAILERLEVNARQATLDRDRAAGRQEQIERRLHSIERTLYKMETTQVTRADLDAGIATLLAAEAARDAAVIKAINDLQAKVAGGSVSPEDFAAELANINTLASNAAALTQTATASDPGPTDVTVPPAAGDSTATDGTAAQDQADGAGSASATS